FFGYFYLCGVPIDKSTRDFCEVIFYMHSSYWEFSHECSYEVDAMDFELVDNEDGCRLYYFEPTPTIKAYRECAKILQDSNRMLENLNGIMR
ncbi:MAG: hypothetical protein AAF153_03455, partial [Pseudomonadota bacterium]